MNRISPFCRTCFLAVFLVRLPLLLAAQDKSPSPNDSAPAAGPLPGHSYHGEAFNEGPRYHAYLMKGMAEINFPVSTRSALAQKFFNQGVCQLHGFWYFEAERSFREVLLLDPKCAMAYWGMARANVQNEKRAGDFAAKAAGMKEGLTRREQMYIGAIEIFYNKDKRDQSTKNKEYAEAYRKIFEAFPNDIEAKAFYCLQIWTDNGGMSKAERERIDKLLKEVIAASPMHPCHHYRIHLWNYNDDKLALNSAARNGEGTPGIAHLWHMPGHTFSSLKMYDDAAWQQEASARVDHAHMMRDRVLPDQIHNYAHNNEWLIRDLINIGRVHDAIELAKNMIELPQHPKYNSLQHGGSSSFGRQRLLDVLIRYELWDDLIKLGGTVYLEPTDSESHHASRLHSLSLAYYSKGDLTSGGRQLKELESYVTEQRAKQKVAGEKAVNDAAKAGKKPEEIDEAKKKATEYLNYDLDKMDGYVQELKAYKTLAEGNKDEARKLFDAAKDIPKERMARVRLALGDRDPALDAAKQAAESGKNEVLPLAEYVDVLNACGKSKEAQEQFNTLRALCTYADLDAPVFQRIAAIPKSLGLSADWRPEPVPHPESGDRPLLDTLGPFRWSPMPAPSWALTDMNDRYISLAQYRGKPVLVFFFLGSGCEHCMQQLNAFAPMYPEFARAGINMVAISADTSEGLKKTFAKSASASGFPFPLVSNSDLKVFKAYRAFDDFEIQPLHGTFLIDGKGLVRWQDINYEPFTETKFLLEEAKRLLAQPQWQTSHRRALTRHAAKPTYSKLSSGIQTVGVDSQ